MRIACILYAIPWKHPVSFCSLVLSVLIWFEALFYSQITQTECFLCTCAVYTCRRLRSSFGWQFTNNLVLVIYVGTILSKGTKTYWIWNWSRPSKRAATKNDKYNAFARFHSLPRDTFLFLICTFLGKLDTVYGTIFKIERTSLSAQVLQHVWYYTTNPKTTRSKRHREISTAMSRLDRI